MKKKAQEEAQRALDRELKRLEEERVKKEQ